MGLSFPTHLFQIFTLVTVLTFASQIPSTFATQKRDNNDQMKLKQSTEFIRTSCQSTRYPSLCFNSLSTHASAIQTSPRHLANAAISVTLSTARTTSAMMSRLSKSNGLKHREAGAMKDCLEELGDSIEELQESMDEMKHMKGKDFGFVMNDVQTWVSAALTDDSTCMDGFSGKEMNGSLKNAVRGKIMNVAHLTRSCLVPKGEISPRSPNYLSDNYGGSKLITG